METIDYEEYIKKLEVDGQLDPKCKMCVDIFYPQIKVGMRLGYIFAPCHKPSNYCESGKHPHCTCDTCF